MSPLRRPRTRLGRGRLAVAAGVLLLVAACLAGLRTRAAADAACALGRRHLPGVTGLDVGLGRCELDPLAQTLTVYGLSLFPPGGDAPLLAADRLEVQLGGVTPWNGTVRLGHVELQRPRVTVDTQAPPAPGPRPRARVAARGGCALESLEHLRVGRLEVRGAEVRVKLAHGQRVEVSGLDVGWRQRRGATADWEVSARGGQLVVGPRAEALRLARLSARGELDPSELDLEVARADLHLDDAALTIKGRVTDLCAPSLALDAQAFLPAPTLARVAALPEAARGTLWVRVGVKGPPHAPSVAVELAGKDLAYGAYSPGDATARLGYASGVVAIEELTLPAGPGWVRVAGSVDVSAPSLPARLEVRSERAQFGRVLERAGLHGAWVDFPATVNATLTGVLAPRPDLAGPLELRSGKFTLATRAWDAPASLGLTILEFDEAEARAFARIGPERVVFSELDARSGGTRIQGEVVLNYDLRQGLRVRGTGDVDLADFGHIAGLPWAGRGRGDFRVEGPYTDVEARANLQLRDLNFWGFGLGVVQGELRYRGDTLSLPSVSGQKGRTPYFGRAQLVFGESLHTRATVEVPRGRTEDLVDVLAGLSPTFALLQGGVLTGAAKGRIEVSGPAESFTGTVTADLADTAYYGRRLGDGQARLRFVDGRALVLDEAELRGPAGRTWARGTFTFAGGLDYRFGGEGLSLAELVGPETARPLGLEGTLTLDGKVEGDAEVPVISGYLSSPRILYAGRDLGPMHLEGRQVGRDAQVWGRPFRDASAFLKVKALEPYPYEATLSLSLPELRPFLPEHAARQGLSGSAAGELKAQGQLLEPMKSRVSATLTRLRLARGDFAGETEGPVQLAWAGGRLDVPSVTFRAPNTQLWASGWVDARALDVSLRGALDMRLLESFVPGLERSAGTLEVDATASGSLAAPALVGSASLTGMAGQFPQSGLAVRGVQGRLEFTAQRVLLEELEGSLNQGRFRAQGGLRLERLAPERLDLAVRLDDVVVRATEDLPATVSGDLTLSGRPPDALVVGGDVELQRLRYGKNLELEDFLLKGGGRRFVLPVRGEAPREWARLDVRVRLGDVRVDNNLMRARLRGDVRLVGTNVRPGLLGTVELVEGSQAFFRNNEFTIDQGAVEFQDRQSFEPVFDVRASSQVREYRVRLHATGRLDNPQVLLSSEPELAEADVLSLLTLGVTSRDEAVASSTTATAGLAAEALLSASGLDRHVERFVPRNRLLRDFNFQISTAYNESTRRVEPSAQLESRILTEQLKLTMTQPVSGRGTRAQAEYQFDSRVSARAQWDNENDNAAFGNLGLELKLGWEVE